VNTKKILIRIIVLLLICVFSFISIYFNSEHIGDYCYRNKMYFPAKIFFKISYAHNNENKLLKKIWESLKITDYNDIVYYGEKLIDNEDYLNSNGEEFVRTVKLGYMIALYESGRKEKFFEFYTNNINKFENAIDERKLILDTIVINPESENDDYRFAIKEYEYILSVSDKIKKADLLIIYGNLKEMYSKIGNNELAKKYQDLYNDIIGK